MDRGASVCSPVGSKRLYPARLRGWGAIEDDTLTVVFNIWCLGGPKKGFLGSTTGTFEYDPDTNTLTDNWGIVWHR